MARSKADSMAYDDAKWRARSDMHALKEAEEIRADKARLKAAQDHAKKEMDMLAPIASPVKKTPRKTSRRSRLNENTPI